MKKIILITILILSKFHVIAQTSGPTQPEVQSFQPVSSADLVNTFTGDFSYNIPLFELPGPDGGYPFNIFYGSGNGMTQEASWVGLGWNLNPGAITRQMRNIPDEFDGTDKVQHFKTMDDSWSVGGTFITPTVELAGGKLPFNMNITVSYNSMTGVGIVLGGDLSFGKADKPGFFSGIGFSSGNLSGLDLNPRFGIRGVEQKSKTNVRQNSLSLGLNLNSIHGMRSMYFQHNTKIQSKRVNYSDNLTFGVTLSFADKDFSPSIEREMEGGTTELSLNIGSENVAVHARPTFKGFYSLQRLKKKGQVVEVPAYGYNHLDKAEANGLSDFNRENDQALTKKIPILPIPVSTYDIYSVSSQGFNASFRAYRGNVGFFEDQSKFSNLSDKNIGLEVGIGSGDLKVAADISVLGSTTDNLGWQLGEEFPKFKGSGNLTTNTYYEPFYYKVFGESTSMNPADFSSMYDNGLPGYVPIGGDFFSGFKLNSSIRILNSGGLKKYDAASKTLKNRVSRQQVIQNFKNGELINADGILNQFDFQFYTVEHLADNHPSKQNINFSNIGNPVSFFRNTLPSHHTGGFEVIKEDGTRYIFALPVYIKEQLDVSFSDFGCDKSSPSSDCPYTIDIPASANPNDPTTLNVTDSYSLLEVTKFPKHAHSYLLTAIIGPDYVDRGNDGITDDDLGYWVKFSYVKTTEDYKWKAPFLGANFIIGQESKAEDNMGVFSCGSREVWYLLSAETSTHIAEFDLSQRVDARGAYSYTQNKGSASTLGARSYKLDKISLYTKIERFNAEGGRKTGAVPIQTVHLNYAEAGDELCKGISNSGNGTKPGSSENRGKLTLQSVHTNYRNNTRGELTPYIFTYNAGNSQGEYNYDQHAVDRWGNYQPDLTGRNKNYFAPYTRQDLDPSLFSAWALKSIVLPSGSLVEVEYEPKEYAYVQNVPTATMQKIVGIGLASGKYYVDVNMPVLPDVIANASCNNSCKTDYIKTLFKGQDQLFVRLFVDLKNSQNETVSAYTLINDIEIVSGNKLRIYVDHAFSEGLVDVHPFQNAVYNYIKGNRLDLFTSPFSRPNDINNTSGLEKVKAVASVIGNVVKMYELFLSVERQCKMDGLGNISGPSSTGMSYTMQGNSYVRIPVLNGRKKGSGARVKSVKIYENADKTGDVTGTVYDYDTEETLVTSGGTVHKLLMSSGVAENEPETGSDENAIKRYEQWSSSAAVFSSITQFSEVPYNSSYYPGAGIGYSKVTVRSLATDKVVKGQLSSDIRTTGQVVNEFYTAKDFPVQTNRTVLGSSETFKHRKVELQLPYIGYSYAHLFASQGFSIELNDMHGKTKKVSYYGQDTEGKISSSPYSWQETYYKTKSTPYVAHRRDILQKLDNLLPLMCSEGNITNKLLGVEVEEFIDLRNASVSTSGLGHQINVDIIFKLPIVIPIPSYLPEISVVDEKVGSCVTNKIVNRFAIVDKVVSFDQGAYSVVKNEAFDELTGQPVLVSTIKTDHPDNLQNASIEKSYKYDIQGHWINEGMDGAYKNIAHEIIPSGGAPAVIKVESGKQGREFLHIFLGGCAPDLLKHYYPGDELILVPYTNSSPDYGQMASAIVISTQNEELVVESISGEAPMSLANSPEGIYIKVIRPGRRNMVGIPVSTIISAGNPLLNRELNECK